MNEVYCSICVGRIERAPVHLTRKTEVRWELPSPKGRSLIHKVELHAYSTIHAWSAAVHTEGTAARIL